MTRVGTIQCDGECGRIVTETTASVERWHQVVVRRRPWKQHSGPGIVLDFCSAECSASDAGLEMYARTMAGSRMRQMIERFGVAQIIEYAHTSGGGWSGR